MRHTLGVEPDEVVLVAFRTGHPSQVGSTLDRALHAAAGNASLLLNLGAGAPDVEDPPSGMRVLSPGRLSEGELAAWLAAGDVFLGAFTDGASTRRTTLMAALQHELAVIASRGPSTGCLLLDADGALELADPEVPGELEASVARVLANPEHRRGLALRGRELFSSTFEWTVIAEQAIDALSVAWAADPPETGPVQALAQRHV
jgi:glycosyltransferase involved in cell wall biosynthesis